MSRGRPSIYTRDVCIADARKYDSKQKWRTESNSIYQAANRNGWLDDCYREIEDKEKVISTQKIDFKKNKGEDKPILDDYYFEDLSHKIKMDLEKGQYIFFKPQRAVCVYDSNNDSWILKKGNLLYRENEYVKEKFFSLLNNACQEYDETYYIVDIDVDIRSSSTIAKLVKENGNEASGPLFWLYKKEDGTRINFKEFCQEINTRKEKKEINEDYYTLLNILNNQELLNILTEPGHMIENKFVGAKLKKIIDEGIFKDIINKFKSKIAVKEEEIFQYDLKEVSEYLKDLKDIQKQIDKENDRSCFYIVDLGNHIKAGISIEPSKRINTHLKNHGLEEENVLFYSDLVDNMRKIEYNWKQKNRYEYSAINCSACNNSNFIYRLEEGSAECLYCSEMLTKSVQKIPVSINWSSDANNLASRDGYTETFEKTIESLSAFLEYIKDLGYMGAKNIKNILSKVYPFSLTDKINKKRLYYKEGHVLKPFYDHITAGENKSLIQMIDSLKKIIIRTKSGSVNAVMNFKEDEDYFNFISGYYDGKVRKLWVDCYSDFSFDFIKDSIREVNSIFIDKSFSLKDLNPLVLDFIKDKNGSNLNYLADDLESELNSIKKSENNFKKQKYFYLQHMITENELSNRLKDIKKEITEYERQGLSVLKDRDITISKNDLNFLSQTLCLKKSKLFNFKNEEDYTLFLAALDSSSLKKSKNDFSLEIMSINSIVTTLEFSRTFRNIYEDKEDSSSGKYNINILSNNSSMYFESEIIKALVSKICDNSNSVIQKNRIKKLFDSIKSVEIYKNNEISVVVFPDLYRDELCVLNKDFIMDSYSNKIIYYMLMLSQNETVTIYQKRKFRTRRENMDNSNEDKLLKIEEETLGLDDEIIKDRSRIGIRFIKDKKNKDIYFIDMKFIGCDDYVVEAVKSVIKKHSQISIGDYDYLENS